MKLEKLNIFLLLLLVVLMPIAYMPRIFQNAVYYSILSDAITLILGIIFSVTFLHNLTKKRGIHKILRRLILILLILTVEFIIFNVGKLNYNSTDLISLIAVLLAIYIGYVNDFKYSEIKFIVYSYCLVCLFLGYLSIKYYVEGFSLFSENYLVDGKNQIGQLLSLSIILLFYNLFFEKRKSNLVFLCIIILITFVFLIIIKCRTAIFASVIAMFIIFHKLASNKDRRKFYYVLFPIMLLFFSIYLESILKIMIDMLGFSGMETSAEITANRSSYNQIAVDHIVNNPLYGELKQVAGLPYIHNWILLHLTRYGLLFTIPFLLYYCTILFHFVKRIVKDNCKEIHNIGYYVLIVPFITSMFEPQAPFAPGTVFILVYILFGFSIKTKNYEYSIYR